MRAMVVAAGLGTRLRPLTELLPKPAVPVQGIPLVAYTLAFLAHAGIREVVINLHHLPGRLADAARTWCPEGMDLHFSRETELLHTGGAIRRVVEFLRESDPCVIVGGDMILDVDLPGLLARHRASGRAATLLAGEHPRAEQFGTLGFGEDGRLVRVSDRFDLGGESRRGVYTWLNVVSTRAFESLPDREVFSHLDDWLAPRAAAQGDVGGELQGVRGARGERAWRPVGTLDEYLDANFGALELDYLDVRTRAAERGVRLSDTAVIGAGAEVPEDAQLERVVVWDDESVPAGFQGRDGVFAGGRFHAASRPSAVSAGRDASAGVASA